MNPFLLGTDDRLARWKLVRKSLPAMTEAQQMATVAQYWSNAPLVSIAYDTTDLRTWPTPWEMLSANRWCRKSIAIGMESTLRLSGLFADRMILKEIIDRDIQDVLLILSIDDQWVLNYDWGSVVPYPTTNHSVLKSWIFKDKAYTLRI